MEVHINNALIADLHRFAGRPGVEIAEHVQHVQVGIQRSGFAITVVVPRSALEFFIEVTGGKHKIEDWLDYSGYDATPEHLLAEEMRAEVLQFVERIASRNLRMADEDRRLEWQVGERWLQAVPFVPDDLSVAAFRE